MQCMLKLEGQYDILASGCMYEHGWNSNDKLTFVSMAFRLATFQLKIRIAGPSNFVARIDTLYAGSTAANLKFSRKQP